MKRLLVSLFLVLFLFPSVVLLSAEASAKVEAAESLALSNVEGWTIESFHADITIPQDGKVQIVETIVADFGSVRKHGINRTIDTTDMKFKLVSVEQDGVEAVTEVSSVSAGKKIRIGDPDKTITGRYTYTVTYEVGKVISRFDDHDEFYWDVTGFEATIPTEKVTVTVSLEGGQIEDAICYTGVFGSREQDCSASVDSQGAAHFGTSAVLPPGHNLSIDNSFPKDIVGDPFYPEDIIKPLWMIGGSLLVLAFMLRRWWRHGRDMWYRKVIILDPKAKAETKPLFTKETVVVQFDPPKAGKPSKELRPAEVGTLIDERVDINDVSATIVDLAVRGYLKIHEDGSTSLTTGGSAGSPQVAKGKREKVYRFEKIKDFQPEAGQSLADEADPPAADLAEYEKEILRGLFERGDKVALDDLEEKFYVHLKKIRDSLYERMTAEGYFVQRPDKVTLKYVGLGSIILSLSFGLTFITAGTLIWLLLPPGVLGFLMLVMSPLMPKKTGVGTEMVRQASGLKLFISKAEKYHQQFNERINRFDQFLPYAMVFGVVDKWVNTFKTLGIEPPKPNWYISSYAFNVGAFSSSMQGINSAFASTLPSTPASSGGGSGFGGGGGFSGGGFGGGGTSGW